MMPERRPLERAPLPLYRSLAGIPVSSRYLSDEEWHAAIEQHYEDVFAHHRELDERDRHMREDQAA